MVTKAPLEVPAGMQRIYRRFERWRRMSTPNENSPLRRMKIPHP